MAIATPERIKVKVDKLHTRLRGFGTESITLVKYDNTVVDDFAAPTATSITTTTLSPLPIVEDQPGDDIKKYFSGALQKDERLFRLPPWSFVSFTPTATLEDRALEFLLARKGQDKGGLVYGGVVYTILEIHMPIYAGGIPLWMIVIGKAQRKVS
jgi:hypothetical protein